MNHSALVLVPENRFAHAAAIRLLDPSNTAVPIVTIYGRSGVGKSHLARHIVREACAQDSSASLMHLTAAEFLLELAKATDARAIGEFQTSYRKHQLLVCEDIQTLQAKSESQLQLLGIINAIVSDGGRVLLTANRAPGELRGLCARLVNRCHGGVCGEIELPGPGTRAVLLQEFAHARGVVLKDHWVQKLAKRMDGTPRELIGAVIRLETIANCRQTCIDDEVISEFLGQLHESEGVPISQIARQVASQFDVPLKDIRNGGRGQALVVPRQVAMYIAREVAQHRYKDIGRYFGGRTHSTVVHACHQIAERLESDTVLWQQINGLCNSLQLSHPRNRRKLANESSKT